MLCIVRRDGASASSASLFSNKNSKNFAQTFFRTIQTNLSQAALEFGIPDEVYTLHASKPVNVGAYATENRFLSCTRRYPQ